jgi:protein-disulfide isomerase
LRHYVVSASVSAGVLLFAAAFFALGFGAHAVIDDDDGGSTSTARESAATPTGPSTQGSPSGQPTPVPLVQASADDDPSWGPADAPVTIIEFSDYQCPYCVRFWSETLPQIREEYEGKVRFVYRDFPLTSIHEWAQKAAEAAECADDEDMFWEYHDLIFANQSGLSEQLSNAGLDGVQTTLEGYASDLGLDAAAFTDCLDSGKYTSEVEKDMQDGRSYGVSGTPAFFINGQSVSGAQPFANFQAVIDAALEEADGGED